MDSSCIDAKKDTQISAVLVLDGMIGSELINQKMKLNIQGYFAQSFTVEYSMLQCEQRDTKGPMPSV